MVCKFLWPMFFFVLINAQEKCWQLKKTITWVRLTSGNVFITYLTSPPNVFHNVMLGANAVKKFLNWKLWKVQTGLNNECESTVDQPSHNSETDNNETNRIWWTHLWKPEKLQDKITWEWMWEDHGPVESQLRIRKTLYWQQTIMKQIER